MDILNRVVGDMNKEQVRFFKLYLSNDASRDDRLDVQLFDYMRRSGENYDEAKIVRKLYPHGSKNSFYRLRNRLLSDVNKSLLLQHMEEDDSLHTLYLLSLEKYHLSRNNFKVALFFLKKAESEARVAENYELLDIIYGDFIRLSNDMPDLNPEHYIGLRKANQHHIKQLRAIDDVLAVVSRKMKLTQNFSSDANPVLSLLQKAIRQYSTDKDLSKSPKLRFRIYHSVTQILLQRRDYATLEQYLLSTWKEFNQEKLFTRNYHDTKLQMLVYLINTLFKNEKLKESLKFTEKLRSCMDEFQGIHFDKYLFYYYNSLVINYSRVDRNKAIETLSEMKAIEKIRSVAYYEFFIYLNLAVCYFDLKDFHQSIRHFNKLFILDGFAATDRALQFKISIAELMVRYELKNFDVLEQKLKLIRKDYKDFIKRRSSSREALMISILSCLIEKESLRSEKSLLSQARQLIINPAKKESGDADILNYASWLRDKIN